MVRIEKEILKDVPLGEGRMKVIKIVGEKHKSLKLDDLQKLIQALENKYRDDGIKFSSVVRAVNCDKPLTLKGYGEGWLDVDDYYHNRAKSTSKFSEFYSSTITMFIGECG